MTKDRNWGFEEPRCGQCRKVLTPWQAKKGFQFCSALCRRDYNRVGWNAGRDGDNGID